VFPKVSLGTVLDVRNADEVQCVLQVERTVKEQATGLGKLLSLGTYSRTKDLPISMSGQRIVAYIEMGLTDFPKERLEPCFSTMRDNMLSQQEEISKAMTAQNVDTFFVSCAEGSKL
jgi:hypothetical protein